MLAVGPDLSKPRAGLSILPGSNMSAIPPYLSRTEVPTYYPVCQRVVDGWIASSIIPIIRVGKKPILRRDDIERHLDSLVASKPKTRRGRPTKAEQLAKRQAVDALAA
jgi:hypothetical protein